MLALLGTTGASARDKWHTRLPEGTPVVVVGQISSPPTGALNEQKAQISLGPGQVDYTLHFGDALMKGPQGQEIDEDALDDGQWVRAEGRIMNDTRRIKVSRLRVISGRKLASLRGTSYYRAGYPYGYLVWPAGETRSRVAGYRSTYRRAQ